MSKKVSLGGDRLGSGAKMDVTLHGYERSTHDLGYIWRSSVAPGTLVPFMKLLCLPGDTFDIKLNADVKTLPTVGPLFGSFKMQMDVFSVPIRLYNAGLHMNRLNIGLDMSKVKFPIMQIRADNLHSNIVNNLPIENKQINQSSLLAYLGIRGLGHQGIEISHVSRVYNAIPMLAYWDIYKNYYANKQEERGAYLTKTEQYELNRVYFDGTWYSPPGTMAGKTLLTTSSMAVEVVGAQPEDIMCKVEGYPYRLVNVFQDSEVGNYDQSGEQWQISFMYLRSGFAGKTISDITLEGVSYKSTTVTTFPLTNIDTMRDRIMKQSFNSALLIDVNESLSPYNSIVGFKAGDSINPNLWSLNGLALKTYQSDIFNNWLNTESIDGVNGISAVTAVSTIGDKFTIDTLNLSKKVYDMLNRVAVSGGSYEDWLSATYAHEPRRRSESPIYLGGLSKEVIFEEVVSQSNVEYNDVNNPLGSLAGRGNLSNKHKGGYIVAKFDEPSYLIGILSLTPRVDYSQGNDWDVKLNNMNDLHKPALDEIGFQDLITEQMAFWESHGNNGSTVYSAGKQPAWLNYMTNYNRTYGSFADSNDQMFMTLNRRYEMRGDYRIKDLTTYIDPQKFNYIFADTRRDAMNFWVQISNNITARRKMSAKLMPNL